MFLIKLTFDFSPLLFEFEFNLQFIKARIVQRSERLEKFVLQKNRIKLHYSHFRHKPGNNGEKEITCLWGNCRSLSGVETPGFLTESQI